MRMGAIAIMRNTRRYSSLLEGRTGAILSPTPFFTLILWIFT